MFCDFSSINKFLSDDPLFGSCALIGSFLFLIQLVLNFFGALDDDEGVGYFKWMSKQALVGFLMMFGWFSLTCKREWDFDSLTAGAMGVGAGILLMMLVALIFRGANKLKSTGSVFCITEAVGKEAFVYQRIPKDGVGKITVSLQGISHEIDAISLGEEIDSFSQVTVLKQSDDRTLVVVPTK
jgi:hypothetical protein